MSAAAQPVKPHTPGAPARLAVAAVFGLILVGLSLFLIVGRYFGLANLPGPLGTRAGLFADLNLVLQIILLLGLTAGYGLARRGHISAHQYNQTFWVLFNIVLVMFIMILAFNRQVISGIPARLLSAYYATSFTHSVLGTLTVLMAVYLLLRMNRLLPKWLRISGWRTLMRATLLMYWVVGLFGIGTYYVWYVQPREVSGAPADFEAEAGTVVVPVANYAYNPTVLEIPAGTTVVFRNDDPDPHTITSDASVFAEGIVEEQQTYTLTFTSEGEFPYYCLYHGAAGGVGMAGIVRVGAPEQAAVLPTAVAPPAPTPQPTPGQPPAEPLGAQSVGHGVFRDHAGRSDAFDLLLGGLPAQAGGDLHAWLTGDGAPLRLGTLDAAGAPVVQFTYADPAGQNLLAAYSGFLVSVEAAGAAPTVPSNSVLLASSLPAGVVGPARKMLVRSDEAPGGESYAHGLVRHTEELFRHARAVNGAALLGDVDGMNRHIEHMLTIIEGQGGRNYGDFDGDGQVQDPGDGYGILRYAHSLAAQASLAAAAPGASDNVRQHAAHLQVVAANVAGWANQAVAEVLAANQAAAPADRQAHTTEALRLTRLMLDGIDANGNGRIEPIAGEGGAYTAYFYSQFMAALGAVPAAGSGVAPPVSTAPATAVSAATATAAPVFITYNNFNILPAQTTIKAGTTVTFLIQDSPHQPYAGQSPPWIFEAPSTLGPGTSWPHTFNQPGTYTILCGYHANMSGTLVVTP